MAMTKANFYGTPEPEPEPESQLAATKPRGRGQDVSLELTEIRTVCSRAETAFQRLTNLKSGSDRYYLPHDPEIDEMLNALSRVVTELKQWQKTGRVQRKING
jgi:hypothetical protein